ncbi:response regulator transcription factor [Phytoactinopolyspora halotolerans]|uniref:Sensory transduction protein RegX3 n=1 Tax=Phytoactinopolyspora halotolerans TaxID=1981512 RepID=A0A6L9S6U5_9ACTN|nr:response regulator transcription factor [Phytoactinopolyspora halotolerans]NED99709.1 response regulator transcription factor [Phytoactinopolyspora halotolerans]
MRVLLVEDDNSFADALTTALRRHGHEVLRAASGEQALTAPTVDLVLLDLGLPDMDGIDVLRKIRQRSPVGVIAVTARGDEPQRVLGLRNGADDYVVKPFGMAELSARMDAVLRRAHSAAPPPGQRIRVGSLEIDLAEHAVYRNGTPVNLTRKEFDLLTALVRAEGAVLSREHILAQVWQTSWRGVGRTLEVHVASLRAKLGAPQLIETVRGVGYRLAVVPEMPD